MAVIDGDQLNIKKWIVFYPVYVNSKKTIAEGRRISVSKACENPTCVEIADCCKHLKLPCAIEIDKAYPRDFMQRGRVRVLLKKEDGALYNPAISSMLFQKLLSMHPDLSRKGKIVKDATTSYKVEKKKWKEKKKDLHSVNKNPDENSTQDL